MAGRNLGSSMKTPAPTPLAALLKKSLLNGKNHSFAQTFSMKTIMPSPAKLLALSLALAVAGIFNQASQAANVVYTVTSPTGTNYDVATFTPAGTPGVGDVVQISAPTTPITLNLNASPTLGGIRTSANTGLFTIGAGGGTLFLNGTGLLAANQIFGNAGVAYLGTSSSGGSLTVAAPISFGTTDLDIGATNTANTPVNINGAITATTNQAINIRGNGTGGITLAGNIGATGGNIAISNLITSTAAVFLSGSTIGGAAGTGAAVTISNTAAGTGLFTISDALGATVSSVTQNSATSATTLSGANSNYVGNTTLTSGTLKLGSTTALGGNAATLTINGGSLDSGVASLVVTPTNAITANNNFTFVGTNALSLAGTVSLGSTAGARTITTTASTLTLNGIISDATATGLTKAGTGTLALTAANAYTGATTVGTAGSGASGGTLTLSGANGSISASSGITINGSGSKLLLDNSSSNNNNRIAGNVTLATGGELNLTGNGATSSTTEAIGVLGIGSGNEIVTIAGTGAGQVQTLTATSFSRTGNGTALIRGTNLQNQATNTTRVTIDGVNGTGLSFVGAGTSSLGVLTNGTDTTLRIVPYFLGDTSTGGTGVGFLTYDTNATTPGLRPLAGGEYVGLTAGYTTPATAQNAKAFNGTITTTSDVTVNSLTFSTASQTLNGSGGKLIVNSGAITNYATTEVIGSGFSGLTLGNGTWNEGIISPVASNVLTINTPINVTGSGGLTKAGGGTLTLTAANLYTGATTLNQGTLNLNNANALGAGSGATFTINPGTTIDNTTAAAITLANNPAVALNGDFTFTGTKDLNFGTGAGTISNNSTVTTNGSTLTIGGNMSGSATLTKAGTGTLVLSGNNTNTGLITVNAGTLIISGDNSGATGGLNLTFGTLDLRSAKALGTGASSFATTATGGSFGAVVNGTGSALTLTNVTPLTIGQTTYGSEANIGGNGDINFGTGAVSFSGVFNTLLLGHGSTFRFNGATTNTAGNSIFGVYGAGNTLVFGSTFTLATNAGTSTGFVGAGNVSLLGTVQNGPAVTSSFAFSSTGTLIMAGANTYTGSTSFNSGTVSLDYTGNTGTKISGIGTGGTLALGGSVLLNLNGAAVTETVGNWTLNPGANTISRTGGSTGKIVSATLTRNAGSTLALGAGGVLSTTSGTANTLFTAGAAGAGGVVGVVGGNDWAAKAATGSDIVGLSTLATNYTNSTATTLSGNADVVTNVAGTALSPTTLRFNGAAARTIDATGGTLTLNQGGILVTPAVSTNTTTITGGTLQATAANNALFIFQNNTSGGLTIASIIGNPAAGATLTKSGAGLLTLSNTSNAYTGATYLNQGTLNIAAETSLGVTPGSATATQLTMAGGTLQFGAANITLSVNRGITLIGAGNTFDTNGNTATIAGIIAGSGYPLTKTGGGTLFLTNAANAFTGPFTISGGVVNAATLANVNTNSSIGRGGVVAFAGDLVLDGGTLQYTGTVAATTNRYYTLTTNGGGFDASGTSTGSLTFSGAMTASGTSGGQTFTLTGTGSGTSAGTLSGTINNGAGTNVTSLSKTGAGIWTLSAANTYTGVTTISAGTLVLSSTGTIASSSGVNLGTSGSQGTLDLTAKSGFTFGVGQTVSGYGTINIGGTGKIVTVNGNIAPGNSTGVIAVNGDLTLAGTTTMELLNASQAAGTGFDQINASGILAYGGVLSIDVTPGTTTLGAYNLFDFASRSGSTTFSAINFLDVGAAGTFDYSTGILTLTAVPEPSTWALLAFSLTTVMVMRRRRS